MQRSSVRFFFVGVALAAAGLASCGGTQQRGNDMSFNPEVEQDVPAATSTELSERDDEMKKALPTPETKVELPLLGVRPDLALSASAPKTARCPCLSVEVGAATDPMFQWQAGPPQTTPRSLAIAVSSRGVECPGGEQDDTKRQPSISAVDIEGNDVIVEIEELREGPPLASGALIPEPGPGGAVYVRPRGKKLPYARTATSARCKVR